MISMLFVPELLPGLAELLQRPPKLPLHVHISTVFQSTKRRLAKIALWVTFLPFEASVALDATLRSLWRMLYSRRRLLEWQTAASVESSAVVDFQSIVQRMWVGPLLSAVVATLFAVTGAKQAGATAGLVLLVWFLSPLAAWWVSRPLHSGAVLLGESEVQFLRRIARLTWRYFEVFVGPQENWLPPDNVQERPSQRVAHRTSPTNMGLALLSNLTAHDMGFEYGAVDRAHDSPDRIDGAVGTPPRPLFQLV